MSTHNALKHNAIWDHTCLTRLWSPLSRPNLMSSVFRWIHGRQHFQIVALKLVDCYGRGTEQTEQSHCGFIWICIKLTLPSDLGCVVAVLLLPLSVFEVMCMCTHAYRPAVDSRTEVVMVLRSGLPTWAGHVHVNLFSLLYSQTRHPSVFKVLESPSFKTNGCKNEDLFFCTSSLLPACVKPWGLYSGSLIWILSSNAYCCVCVHTRFHVTYCIHILYAH